MQFAYKAKEASGKLLEGLVEAADQKAAIARLREQRLTVVEIRQKAKKSPFFKPKVDTKDVVVFSRQLSTLVSAGIPIVQGLNILEAQAENPAFKTVVSGLRTDIESGLSIADAMRKHPQAFTELYVSMIKAGEVGGILDTILERLSGFLEASEALKAKVKSALMYPTVVGGVAFLITVFLIVFIIPVFKDIFSGFGAELPFPTRMIILLSDTIRGNIVYILAAVGGGVWGVKKYIKTEKGQEKLDDISLKLPVFGILLKKVAIAKFTRTLGTLIKSGVPILQGLETVAKTSGNKIIERAIYKSRDSIKEGGRISDPLKKADIFPPMVIQMISVGEETGGLDNMLNKIADFYDQEVDTAVKGLTSMIEPLIMVVMGVVIGAIVIAMFMPMFSMGELAGKG
ncbi:MAG: pilus assembly protein PilC [Elusimicrobia bacterium GWA2_56_46]|nr:MAG: pilus assembly protein PilC [Elusimicrobia bacterium GWA2_56_46]OGR55166.1 MAG: pilus assembly protein PilC [Elusimicrobia bacterium GWC2_56_31]HBB66854.1 pilus assembly protein PilC [Elusimicrobiota bacterium]HBW23762.1 pilus assembly protein PilC [Elusimicrobiota bacterium]